MKIKSLIAAVAFLALLAPPAKGEEVIMFTGLQTSGTFGCVDPTGATIPCDLNGWNKVSVQFTCTAGPCTDEIQLQQRNTKNDAWTTVLDLFNTGANDLGYSNVGFGQIQVVVTYTGGTLKGTLVRVK